MSAVQRSVIKPASQHNKTQHTMFSTQYTMINTTHNSDHTNTHSQRSVLSFPSPQSPTWLLTVWFIPRTTNLFLSKQLPWEIFRTAAERFRHASWWRVRCVSFGHLPTEVPTAYGAAPTVTCRCGDWAGLSLGSRTVRKLSAGPVHCRTVRKLSAWPVHCRTVRKLSAGPVHCRTVRKLRAWPVHCRTVRKQRWASSMQNCKET
jgi:hypothetical protein